MRMRAAGLAAALLLAAAPAAAERLYALPEAGSYELPPIDRVADRQLLDAEGERAPLLGLGPSEVALVAFVYLSCTDADGCPLALATLQQVDRAVAARPELASRVQLVTVSFDPARDDPEAMAHLRHHMKPRGAWRFLTAESREAIEPVLSDFGQDAVLLLDAEGASTDRIRHVTKVFLVDGGGRVRNVYSSGFLVPELVVRDLETVLGEEGVAAAR